MKPTDYSKKTKADLEKKAGELISRRQALVFKIAANQVKDVREAREIRKEVARLKTAMSKMN